MLKWIRSTAPQTSKSEPWHEIRKSEPRQALLKHQKTRDLSQITWAKYVTWKFDLQTFGFSCRISVQLWYDLGSVVVLELTLIFHPIKLPVNCVGTRFNWVQLSVIRQICVKKISYLKMGQDFENTTFRFLNLSAVSFLRPKSNFQQLNSVFLLFSSTRRNLIRI